MSLATIRTVNCAACGRKVPRAARQQTYCSTRCRMRAYRDRRATAIIFAFPTQDTGRVTIPPKLSRNFNGLQGAESRPSFDFKTPLTLLGVGWPWPDPLRLERGLLAKIVRAEIGGDA